MKAWSAVVLSMMMACGKPGDSGDDTDPGDSDSDSRPALACPPGIDVEVIGRSWTWAYSADAVGQGYSGGYVASVAAVVDADDALQITYHSVFAFSSPSVTDYSSVRDTQMRCDADGYHLLGYSEDYMYPLGSGTAQGTVTVEYTDPYDIPADPGDGFEGEYAYTFTDSATGGSQDVSGSYSVEIGADETIDVPALGSVTATPWVSTEGDSTSTEWRIAGTGRVKTGFYDLTEYDAGE